MATALLAQLVAKAAELKNPEQLFLASLLHDIGRMALSTLFPDNYQSVLASAASRNIDVLVAEQEFFGLTHVDVTRELLTDWKIPQNILNAAWPHGLAVGQIKQAMPDSENALVVALANRLAHALALGDSGNAYLLPIRDYIQAIGLNGEAVQAITQDVVESARDIRSFYGSLSDESFCNPLPVDLAQTANEQPRLIVCASGIPNDPLSLFCKQLGWLDSVDPALAILYAVDEAEFADRLSELGEFEHSFSTKLPILIASPNGSIMPQADAISQRAYGTLPLPSRYTNIIDGIPRFHKSISSN